MRVKHVGPRKPYAPPAANSISMARLKALIPRLTVEERADVQRIIDAQGRGYPNLGWLVDRYEALAQPDPEPAALVERAELWEP